jgi:LysM repeat protein/soluble lytic murein transglycosylase-like protein
LGQRKAEPRYDTVIVIKKKDADNSKKEITEPASDKKQVDNATQLRNKIASAVKPFDSSRLIKKRTPYISKNQSKSNADPNALSLGNFKVSEELYGAHAAYILDYVKNYHTNFGARLTRVKNSNKGYFSFIDNTMKKNSIPKEMHSLAVIESALNPNAVSPVGATGPWQFMEPTAELLGLRVDEELDERRDFYKSTHAAAKFCKRLHNIFHDWLLVVAAYNCGPSPVLRHLSKTGGRSFWDIKQFLPKETQNHVMAFIAVSVYYDKNSNVLDLGNLPKLNSKGLPNKAKETKPTLTKNASKKNAEEDDDLDVADEATLAIDPNSPQFTKEELMSVLTLRVKGAYNLEVIAEVLNADVKKLRRWNPKFNELAFANTGPVNLTIPSAAVDAFILKKSEILKKCIAQPHPASGETINLDPKQIAKAPNFANIGKTPSANVTVEQVGDKKAYQKENVKEIAYQKEKEKEKENEKENENEKEVKKVKEIAKEKNKEIQKEKTYIVKRGDNLTHIAETFGLTVARLMEINKLKKQVVVPGQSLFLE